MPFAPSSVLATTVDGRNIQTLSTTRTPSTPKLNVRGLARMLQRMDETNQTLETQIQSSYEVLQECCGEWTKQIKPWKHKFNQVMRSCKIASANGRNKSNPGNTNSIKL